MFNKEKSVSGILWKNYLFMIIASTLLTAVPFLLIIMTDAYVGDRLVCSIYTAESIMEDSIEEISADKVIENKGGVQIITKDLDVISLGGLNTIKSDKLTIKEWTEFLTNINYSGEKIYTVAYNEKEGFWVVVEFPIAFCFQFYFDANKESADYTSMLYYVSGILAVYIILVIVSIVVYSKITAKNFVRPINELCDFVKRLEMGHYKQRITKSKVREFNELQDGFNHLAVKLEQQNNLREEMQEKKDRLIRDISHDLKNPLASIQGYSEMYLKQAELPDETKENYIKIIHSNSLRSNELITSLFNYSQIDSSDFQLDIRKQDICELLRERLVALIPILEEREFLFEIDIPEDEVFCMVDIVQISRVFDNILDNALKYNEYGTNLSINVWVEGKNVIIEIKDNGIGIDKKTAEYIFEPFIRADETVRNSKTGGSGLGLAIAKKIVELHDGSISIETEEGGGCKFIISLKKI